MKTREIKFRGQRIDNGEWIYGSLVVDYQIDKGSSMRIVTSSGPYEWVQVKSETVGQYTGLKDRNGNEIYEGDILEMVMPISINGTHLHQVEIFSQGYAFWFKTTIYPGYTDCLWFHYNDSQRKIIGNIHQHPSLLTPQTDK